MKLVYAVDKLSYNGKDHIGVRKKVESHCALFRKHSIETTLCQYMWEGGYPQIAIEKDTDVLYFRRIEPSVKMILKLRQLRKINPKLRMIMEIPTYPFAAEEREKISWKRRVNRRLGEIFLKSYVNKIVLIGQKNPIKTLYHIPVICVNNGVNFENIAVRNVKEKKSGEQGIHMICVSGCFFWHGYDRIIEGMHQYYEKYPLGEKIFLHVVGEGECLEEYRCLAEKYGLEGNTVFFYGRKEGKELDVVYDQCDIALDEFGPHRQGLDYSCSLKTREYAAKGFPIVSSIRLDICQENTKDYIQMFPAEEVPVSMERIAEFYHRVYDGRDKQKAAAKIRETFHPYCDLESVFWDVISYIKEGEVSCTSH